MIRMLVAVVAGLATMSLAVHREGHAETAPVGSRTAPAMVTIPAGSFRMGDVFGDGPENERPVHGVTLRAFSLARHETTVGQFRAFVTATGYQSSAEHAGADTYQAIAARKSPSAPRLLRHFLVLQEADGAAFWDTVANRWQHYVPGLYWTNPGFAQSESHPVVAVSWDDAIRFCNWLSRREGLPPAYDEVSGSLLDASGASTVSTEAVAGYRLPTEAEWEYAARDGGREIRFSTGNVARNSEINFRADAGSYAYLEKAASSRRATVPVGDLPANALGLSEMSGNAWEWTSDHYAPYTSTAVRDPYAMTSDEVPQHALRGGRWGGDASEARTFSRSGWVRNDRCNNSGFRVARSLPGRS